MQLLMAGVFGAVSVSAAVTGSGSGFSDRIVICTPSGLKSITLNDDGSVPEDTPGGSENCVWCMFSGNHAPLTSSPIELVVPSRLVIENLCDPIDEFHNGRTANNSFNSRAPPL